MLNVQTDGRQWILGTLCTEKDGTESVRSPKYFPDVESLLCYARQQLLKNRSKKAKDLYVRCDKLLELEEKAMPEIHAIANKCLEGAKEYLKNTELLAREKALRKRRAVR